MASLHLLILVIALAIQFFLLITFYRSEKRMAQLEETISNFLRDVVASLETTRYGYAEDRQHTRRDFESTLREAEGRLMREESKRLVILTDEVRASRHTMEKALDQKTSSVVNYLDKKIAGVSHKLGRKLLTEYRQVESLMALYRDIDPVASFPDTRGWAASPDLLRFLWTEIRRTHPDTVLECGSGVSSIVLGYACSRNGSGRVVSLEHDEEFAQNTAAMVADHGLQDIVDVRVAPLRPSRLAGHPLWYDMGLVPEELDLVFVDGPPAAADRTARFPTIPLLYDRLSPRATIVMDDHIRVSEVENTRAVLRSFDDLHAEEIQHEKATVVVRRRDE